MAEHIRRHGGPPAPPPLRDGRVEGRISIVQEDRFRLMDVGGRGYLFVTRKRAASLEQLEAWRDARVRLGGVPGRIRSGRTRAEDPPRVTTPALA
jgi:hypothetical protein